MRIPGSPAVGTGLSLPMAQVAQEFNPSGGTKICKLCNMEKKKKVVTDQ